MNSIEEAQGYQRLIDEFSYDQDKVAKFIGKSRSHVSNCLRLLTLPKDVIELIEQNKISQGHAKVLVGLNNSSLIAKKIIDKNLSVRQVENLVKIFRQSKSSLKKAKDPNLNQLEISLSEKIGLSVFIRNKKNNRSAIF